MNRVFPGASSPARAILVALALGACGYTPPGGNPPNCNPGYTDCNDGSDEICTDTMSDSNNCGSCGNACKQGWLCYGGACIPKCPAGFAPCSGRCADLSIDPDNCGACGAACDTGQTCSAGRCSTSCPAGYSVCSPAEAAAQSRSRGRTRRPRISSRESVIGSEFDRLLVA
jgi:hypothetical protein